MPKHIVRQRLFISSLGPKNAEVPQRDEEDEAEEFYNSEQQENDHELLQDCPQPSDLSTDPCAQTIQGGSDVHSFVKRITIRKVDI